MFEIIKQYVPTNKYSIKCPYSMDPIGICVHNTANDASAKSEVNYMIGNNNQVSYHVAIDDQYAVECIPFNRNAWHAGDGGSGQGNRKYISIEICYSRSGGSKFDQAEKNAARYIAMLLKEYGWGISHVKKHQDFSGKYCPHRTLDYGWQRFLDMISAELGNTVDTDNVVKSFKDRYQVIDWNGKRVHVYKQTDDLDIGLMSADDKKKVDNIASTTKTITIYSSDWYNGEYTLFDSLITATSNQEFLAPIATDSNKAIRDMLVNAQLKDAGQGVGWAKLICEGTVPTSMVQLRVIFRGEK